MIAMQQLHQQQQTVTPLFGPASHRHVGTCRMGSMTGAA
jgi:hypothetical protein